jgi:hypothetical protein
MRAQGGVYVITGPVFAPGSPTFPPHPQLVNSRLGVTLRAQGVPTTAVSLAHAD